MTSFSRSIQSLTLSLQEERKVLVRIGYQCLAALPNELESLKVGKKLVVITQEALSSLYAASLQSILEEAGFQVSVILLPDGESAKNLSHVSRALDQIFELKLERNDTVIAMGGGVVGDCAGFIASIYLRGINLVHLPSTLLACVDSSIGGKTGVNHEKGKNLIGSFYQARLVFMDLALLRSLPKREWLCGLAEVVKYGVISNTTLFSLLETRLEDLITFDLDSHVDLYRTIISESASDKLNVVAADEKESGQRAFLNFGHTIGHAIEAVFGYGDYLHGEAVAIGMYAAMLLAEKMGRVSQAETDRLKNLLVRLGFGLRLRPVSTEKLIETLAMDKKVQAGKIRFVLPSALGHVEIVDTVDLMLVRDVLDTIKK